MSTRRIVQFLAVFGFLVVVESYVSAAATFVDDPFGNASSTGFVNRDPSDGSHWINWQNNSTGACAFSFLGNGGLSESFWVGGLGGNDTLWIVSDSGRSSCGYSMSPPNYNGYYIDMAGGDGNDYLNSGTGNSFMDGDAGDDVLVSRRGDAVIQGITGNDTILIAALATGSGGTVTGGFGNDCIQIGLMTSMNTICGPGTDTWSGPGTLPSDCEINQAVCCPGFVC